jgi:hypothetical protein
LLLQQYKGMLQLALHAYCSSQIRKYLAATAAPAALNINQHAPSKYTREIKS